MKTPDVAASVVRRRRAFPEQGEACEVVGVTHKWQARLLSARILVRTRAYLENIGYPQYIIFCKGILRELCIQCLWFQAFEKAREDESTKRRRVDDAADLAASALVRDCLRYGSCSCVTVGYLSFGPIENPLCFL